MGRGKFLSGFLAFDRKGSCFQPWEVFFYFFSQDHDLLQKILIFFSVVQRPQLGFLFV